MLFQRSLGAITTSAILAAGNTHAIVSSEVRRYDFAADITVTSGGVVAPVEINDWWAVAAAGRINF